MIISVLGRDQEDRLVFGWCARCVEETGCTRVETEAVRLTVRRPPLRRRVKRLRRKSRTVAARLRAFPWNSPVGRRLLLLILTLILSTWSAVLAALAAFRLIWPGTSAPSPTGNGTSAFLLAGSASIGLLSVFLLTWLARPSQRAGILTTLVTIASGSVSVLSLALWLTRPIPGQWLTLAAASLAAFVISGWLGHRMRQAGSRFSSRVSRPLER